MVLIRLCRPSQYSNCPHNLVVRPPEIALDGVQGAYQKGRPGVAGPRAREASQDGQRWRETGW